MLEDACCFRTFEQKEVCGERNKSEPDSVYENVRGAALWSDLYVLRDAGDITGALCIMTSGPTDATESRAHLKKNNRDREHCKPWGGLTKSEMHMEGSEMKLLQ